jgi:hypothetical protein
LNYAPQPGLPTAPPPRATTTPLWRLAELLEIGWQAFAANWVVLSFGPLLAASLALIPGTICFLVFRENLTLLVTVGALGLFLSTTILLYFQVGLTRIVLSIAKGGTPSFGMLFSSAPMVVPYVLASLIVGVVVEIGTFFFIVPGVVLLSGLLLTPFFVVEHNLGPMEAMRASWDATRGHKGRICAFAALASIATIIGTFALGVGALVAFGVALPGLTTIYVRLSGRPPS